MAASRLDPRLRLVVAAALFSTGGAAIKAAALTSWQIASFRSGIAAVTVWLGVRAARGRWTPRVLLVATIYAATMVLFVVANKLTTSANAIFLQDTAPVWVLIASPLLLRERIRRADLLFMAVIAGGMLLCFLAQDAPQSTAPDPARGNVIAALSGVAWAGTVLGLRWLGRGTAATATTSITADMAATEAASGRGDAALVTVVAGNVIACLACLPLALPVTRATPASWLVVLYLGVVQIGIAYLALAGAMAHVPALAASTLLLVEPALNPVWAYAVHGERPAPLAWAGGALILLSALAKTAWDARRERMAAPRRSPAPGAMSTVQP